MRSLGMKLSRHRCMKLSRHLQTCARVMGCGGSKPESGGAEPLSEAIGGPSIAHATSRTLNVVCLHGLTMNADRLRSWEAMRSLEQRCNGIAKFYYISAPHKFEANAWSELHQIPVDNQSRAWFTEDSPKFGWGASQTHMSNFLSAQVEGPIDVLIGYSQGGLMIANILRYLAGAEPYRSLRGAVFIHAPDFYGNAPNHQLCPSLKTVHIIGKRDQIGPLSSSAALAGRFVHTKTVSHDGEHYFFAPFPRNVLDSIYHTLASLNRNGSRHHA